MPGMIGGPARPATAYSNRYSNAVNFGEVRDGPPVF